jgi:hypothetical protein
MGFFFFIVLGVPFLMLTHQVITLLPEKSEVRVKPTSNYLQNLECAVFVSTIYLYHHLLIRRKSQKSQITNFSQLQQPFLFGILYLNE